MVYSIAYAQRNHYLQANILVTPNKLTKEAIQCLLRSGLVIHYCPKRDRLKGGSKALFCFTLRY